MQVEKTTGFWEVPEEYSFGDLPLDNDSVRLLDMNLIRSLAASSGTQMGMGHRTFDFTPAVSGPGHGPAGMGRSDAHLDRYDERTNQRDLL